MRSLVFETSKVQNWPAPDDVTTIRRATLSTPIMRPRIEGADNAMRGPAIDAIVVDRGEVTFSILPNKGLGYAPYTLPAGVVAPTLASLVGALQIVQYRKDGTIDALRAFPTPAVDVTGYLFAGNGKLTVDIEPYGVCQVFLTVGWYADPASVILGSMTQIQVYGDVQTHQWESERSGQLKMEGRDERASREVQ